MCVCVYQCVCNVTTVLVHDKIAGVCVCVVCVCTYTCNRDDGSTSIKISGVCMYVSVCLYVMY